MPPQKNTDISKKIASSVGWYALAFITLIFISYYFELSAWIANILGLFAPVLLGLAFAYILNPLFRWFERKLFSHLYPSSLRRAISLIATYVVFLLLMALLILLIIPELLTTLIDFISNYTEHVNVIVGGVNALLNWMNSVLGSVFGKYDFFKQIDGTQFFDALYRILNGYLAQIDIHFIASTAGAFFSGLTDIIFALFISIYFLSTKEKRYAQVMKLRNALFSEKTNKSITRLCATIDNLFGKFLEGRILDSLILGTILYIFLALFGIKQAIIIAVFIAITNIIPYVGFLIGAVPSALLVLLTDYTKILPFLIILFLTFQFDSNIVSPKIVGSNTGISSLCVIIAICVMGAMFGIVGMLLGVPLFATVLDYGNSIINARLQKKRLPSDVDNYYAPDPIIDTVHISRRQSTKLINRVERRALRADKSIESGHENRLSALDKFCVKLHKVAKRLHIYTTPTPDLLIQFSVEEKHREIKENSTRLYENYKSALENLKISEKEGEA